MQHEDDVERAALGFLIVGVVVLVIGLPLLSFGLYGYFWILPHERDSVSEAAEEMGLSDIPGVSDNTHFWDMNIIIGCIIVTIGAFFTALAI